MIHACLGMNPDQRIQGNNLLVEGFTIVGSQDCMLNINAMESMAGGACIPIDVTPNGITQAVFGRSSDMPGPWPTRSEAGSYSLQAEMPG